jgi:quercetin 2,3-dioxygenase
MVLPRIPAPDPPAADRPVVSVTTAPSGLEGEGFPMRRAFAGVDLRALDPSVHMDQMGESSTPRASQKAPRGTRTGASKPSPT